MTGVIDLLERAGYVTCTRHRSDRRKVIVSLNDERIERKLGPDYEPQAAHRFAVIRSYRPEELAVIADFLERAVSDPFGAQDVAKLVDG